MKTPDEIKKGLDCCGNNTNYCRNDCPYLDGCHLANEFRQVERDALAYIQQLERERDGLLRALAQNRSCADCKHKGNKIHRSPCRECLRDIGEKPYWEWRGVKESCTGASDDCTGASGV